MAEIESGGGKHQGGARRQRKKSTRIDMTAMVDVALERGIERYTGVIPDPFRKEVLAPLPAQFQCRANSRKPMLGSDVCDQTFEGKQIQKCD